MTEKKKRKKKTVVILVANKIQLPLIEFCALQEDIELITIDNNPDNPGHKFADENYFIDVFDTDAIISTLKKNPPDAVLAFASAHGVKSASLIGEYFNIPHIPIESLDILTSKDLFRDFLKQNNFAYPRFKIYNQFEDSTIETLKEFNFPIIIKPIDNGANRGITKIEWSNPEMIKIAFNYALVNSPSKTIIVEEFIDSEIKINGDGFMQNGKLIYGLFGDYIYNKDLNPILPVGTSFPSKYILTDFKEYTEKLLALLDYNGAFNVEAIIKEDKIYFIEFNTRHSGNYIFDLISEDLEYPVEQLNLDIALGNTIDLAKINSKNKSLASFIIASSEAGRLQEVENSSKLIDCTIKSYNLITKNAKRNNFETLSDRIEVLLLNTNNYEKIEELFSSFNIKLK